MRRCRPRAARARLALSWWQRHIGSTFARRPLALASAACFRRGHLSNHRESGAARGPRRERRARPPIPDPTTTAIAAASPGGYPTRPGTPGGFRFPDAHRRASAAFGVAAAPAADEAAALAPPRAVTALRDAPGAALGEPANRGRVEAADHGVANAGRASARRPRADGRPAGATSTGRSSARAQFDVHSGPPGPRASRLRP